MLRRLLITSAVVLTGCAGTAESRSTVSPKAEASATPAENAPAKSGAIVASGGGLQITMSELDEKLGAETLADLRQKEYDLRSAALEELLGEKLIEKEAAARGITVDELKEREINKKTPPPNKAEVDRLYQENQPRLARLTRERGLETVENAIQGRDRQMRAAAFRRELVKKHGVKVLIDPPRYAVAVPSDAPTLGPAKAPITIVGFADYQCPYCHRAQGAVEEILKRYSGKVRLVHRDFPLESIHDRAIPAARASRCAGEQGKFWEYHRDLLAATSGFSEEDFKKRATAIGLNMTSFGSCLAQTSSDEPIRASVAEGLKIGVNSTPTFFVNGRRLVGAKSVEDFVAVIEDELLRASS
jgi:protein-disulfide isomerase